MEYEIIKHEEQVLGRLAMIRGHGFEGEPYGHMLMCDLVFGNTEILPPWLDSSDPANWPEMRATVDAAEYDLNTYFGFGDIPMAIEHISPLVCRVAYHRAHAPANWGNAYAAMFLLDRFSRNTRVLPHDEAKWCELMLNVDYASHELDVIEHDQGDCPKMHFLEDPITMAYGVGNEFVDGINCAICDNRRM
jgi:hypothetical protein